MPSKGRRWEHARGIMHKRKMQDPDLTVKKAELKEPKKEEEKEIDKTAQELVDKALKKLDEDKKEE